MYRQRHGSIHPHRVAELLTCDVGVPCSIRFSVQAANTSLHGISGSPIDQYVNSAEKHLGKLFSDLVYADMSWILKAGLHEFLNDTVARLHCVGDQVRQEFFAPQETQPTRRSSEVGGVPIAVNSPQTGVGRPNMSQLSTPHGSRSV